MKTKTIFALMIVLTISTPLFGQEIFQAIRNRVTDAFRKKRKTVSLTGIIQDSRYDAAGVLERKELKERIMKAIDSLRDEQKAVVIATEFEGRSFRDISEDWAIPLGTLLARKSRALKKIKQELNGFGYP